MPRPGQYTLKIYQGTTFDLLLTWRDGAGALVNLTGYTARMQIRWAASLPDVLADLTTTNGKIVLGGAAGTIQLLLTAAETAAFLTGQAVYDLELVQPGGGVIRLLQGPVTISPEVTR